MPSDINWFPGHMRKALRSIEEQIKLVDVVIETADARIPFSSRNPELEPIISVKPRLLVLNKSDLADPDVTAEWISYCRNQNIPAVACDAAGKKGLQQVRNASKTLCSDVLERARAKGRIGRPIRAMVVGIPNSGKSTLINGLCNRKMAVTGDRPGVTRGFQWARTDNEMELMDMPGVLWPKIATRRSQLCLTMTGAIRTEVVDIMDVAVESFALLQKLYPKELYERYKLTDLDVLEDDTLDTYDIFLKAAKNRGCIMSGGRIDENRFAHLFLDDFRNARIARITLEKPEV